MSTNEQLIRAVQRAARKLASSGNFDSLLHDVLAISVQAVGAGSGTIYIREAFQTRHTVVSNGGRSAKTPTREIEEATGIPVASMLTVPLMMEDEEPIGVVQIINKIDGDFTASDVAVMDTVASGFIISAIATEPFSRVTESRMSPSRMLAD